MIVSCQAHLVAAFEQSLGNMTIRLKSLTLTAEQKVKTEKKKQKNVWFLMFERKLLCTKSL